MRDVFIGLLCSIAFFLIAYKGYDDKDNILTNIAGIMALGVALFPTISKNIANQPTGVFQLSFEQSHIVHLLMTISFFATFAYITLALFTIIGPGSLTKQKKLRNRIYKINGVIVLVSLILITMIPFALNTSIEKLPIILIFESVCLIAFGVSWLIKGEALFKDK